MSRCTPSPAPTAYALDTPHEQRFVAIEVALWSLIVTLAIPDLTARRRLLSRATTLVLELRRELVAAASGGPS